MSSTVKDVMSTHVMAVRPGAGYREMAAMLREQRVSAFPVIDDGGKVIGVVSESDLLVKEALEGTVPGVLRGLTQRHVRSQVTGLTAADLMTRPAVTIGPDEPASHAARLMYSKRVKRLPVVGADGTLIGIVARSDVLSVYRRPDAEIRREIIEDLILGTYNCDPARFDVTVKSGVVTIAGRPETAETGCDIVAAARHLEGVVAVRDRLSYQLVTTAHSDPPPD
jgi:CBS-domain-containing membrane protein